MRKLKPITPGELLLKEFLKPMGISQYRLAKEIGVPAQRIDEIVAGKRAVTADTDFRLCRFFGLSNGYGLRAQSTHDTKVAERTLCTKLAKIKPWTDVEDNISRTLTRSTSKNRSFLLRQRQPRTLILRYSPTHSRFAHTDSLPAQNLLD